MDVSILPLSMHDGEEGERGGEGESDGENDDDNDEEMVQQTRGNE